MKKLAGLLFSAIVCVAGCAENLSPNTYQSADVGVASKVDHGVVIGKRFVKLSASRGEVGGLAGAGTGAVLGSGIGGSSKSNIIGAIGGAVLGGVAGHAADNAINNKKGYEYIVKLKNGETISVAQMEDLQFYINQRVLVIYGAKTRIVPDESIGN